MPNSYMLVSMDFRHVMEQELNWVYGEDWDVSFMISVNEFMTNVFAEQPLVSPGSANYAHCNFVTLTKSSPSQPAN